MKPLRSIGLLALLLAIGAVATAQRGGGTRLSGADARVLRARLPSGAVVTMIGSLEIEIRGASATVTHTGSGLVGTARAGDVDFVLAREVSLHDGAIVLVPGAPIVVTRIAGPIATIDVTGLSMALRSLRVPLDALGIGRAPMGGEPESFAAARAGERRVLVSRVPLRLTPEGGALEATIDSNAVVTLLETRGRFARVARLDQGSLVRAWVPVGALVPAPPPTTGGGGMGVGGRLGLSGCPEGDARPRELDGELFSDVRGATRVASYRGLATVGAPMPPRQLVPVIAMPGITRIERCDRPIAYALDVTAPDAGAPSE